MNLPVILHVDDADDSRRALELAVGSEYRVVGKQFSRDAAGLVAGRDFDVAVLDHEGFEFGEELRARDPFAPIVVFSARPDKARFTPTKTIAKGAPDWDEELLAFLSGAPCDLLESLSESQRNMVRGKVLIVGGRPERIIIAADSIDEARQQFRASPFYGRHCQIMQGPPAAEISREEFLSLR